MKKVILMSLFLSLAASASDFAGVDDLFKTLDQMKRETVEGVIENYKVENKLRVSARSISDVSLSGVQLDEKNEEVVKIVLSAAVNDRRVLRANGGIPDFCQITFEKVPVVNASGQHVEQFRRTEIECSAYD